MVIRHENWTNTSFEARCAGPNPDSKLDVETWQHCNDSAIQILALEYIRGRMNGDTARIRRILDMPDTMHEKSLQCRRLKRQARPGQSLTAHGDTHDPSTATRLAMQQTSAEAAVRAVIARLDAAWKELNFDGFEECFHEHAVIVGPGYTPAASGRTACAQSYREFASNAAVLDYSESDHRLHLWAHTAVYTFAWRMTYEREAAAKSETGTDQLVLGLVNGQWRILFRHIYFAPQESL